MPEVVDFDDADSALNFPALVGQLRAEVTKLRAGDTTVIEGTLLGQAKLLQTLLATVVEWIYSAPGREALEARIPLALRIQNHCRMTLETLGRIRDSGRTMVIQQQQVVMQSSPPSTNLVGTEAGRPPFGITNELLEAFQGERLDSSASSTSIATDPQLASVGKRRS